MVRTLFTPIKGGMVRLGHVPPQLLEIHYNRDIGSLVVDAATSRSSSFQIDVLLVTWWIKVFVCFPFKMSIAPGVRPSAFGSSGILVKNWSRMCLNSSWFPLKLRTFFGRQFHSFGPATWKLWRLKFCTEDFPLDFLIWQRRPLRSSQSVHSIPQFGTNLWIIFCTQIIWYLSSLLCSEFIASFSSLCQ